MVLEVRDGDLAGPRYALREDVRKYSATINIVNVLLIFLRWSFTVALDTSLGTVFSSSVSSLRLAYRDLDIKAREETLNLSGKKKSELERLGMGLGSNRRYVEFWKLYLKYPVVLCSYPTFYSGNEEMD